MAQLLFLTVLTQFKWSVKEFDQDSVIINPDLPSDALSSKQFNTIVEIISEGEIEGFATPSKRGIASNNDAYFNAANPTFL